MKIGERRHGIDGTVRKVLGVNGHGVTFQAGLHPTRETVSRAEWDAWVLPPRPGVPTPDDHDGGEPGMVLTPIALLDANGEIVA